MYYMQRPEAYFRDYGSVGYLVNVRERRDRVLDPVGTSFLARLGRQPRGLPTIAGELASQFDVDPEVITPDAVELFDELTRDGFLAAGASKASCERAALDPIHRCDASTGDHEAPHGEIDSAQFLARYFAADPRLIAMQVELTSQCNERCLHCYIPTLKRERGIDQDFFKSILRQAAELQLISLSLSGGEPMLHPRFTRLLEMASDFDFSLRILSNLTLLDDARLRAMVKARVGLVSVSVYSLVSEVHDAVTQRRGSLAKTLAAIDRVRESGIAVSVNTPLLTTNRDSVGDVMRWAREQGMSIVTDCTIMARYDHSSDNLKYRLTRSDVRIALQQIVDADPDYLRGIRKDGADARRKLEPDRPVCGVGISTISVVANGNVNPCAGWQGEVLGNLYEQSLAEIWRSSPRLAWLRSLRMGDLPECLSCADSAFCAICMVRNANSSATGDPLELSRVHCETARVNHDIVRESLHAGR